LHDPRLYVVPANAGHAVAADAVQILAANAKGEIDLPSTAWQGRQILIVTAPQYRPVTVSALELLTSSRGGRARVVLPYGIRLSGRVITPWGSPIPDAEVVGYGRYGADFDDSEKFLVPGPSTAGDVIRARTGGDGSFHLAGIGQLPVRLEVRKPGFVQDIDREAPPLLAEKEQGEYVVTLRPRLLGGLRIVDETTKDLVTDFRVQFDATQDVSHGPILSQMTASYYEQPGRIPELGVPFRAGEYWIGAIYGNSATGLHEEGRVQVTVTSPWYEPTRGVLVPLRSVTRSEAMTPAVVGLVRSGSREEWGSLRVRVLPAAHLSHPLPWADVRVEQSDAPADPAESRRVAWTYRIDLDDRGVATRPIALAPGHYNVRLADGTGWATWKPSPQDAWSAIEVSPRQDTTVDLEYRASLLRVTVKSAAGGPIGMFSLTAHFLPPLPPGKGAGGLAPTIANLSEYDERWWDDPAGAHYRTHLQMAPGVIEVLAPPGRLRVFVSKTGFQAPEQQYLDLASGQVGNAEFLLEPVRIDENR